MKRHSDPVTGNKHSENRDRHRAVRNSMLNLAGVVIPAALAILATPILLRNLGYQGFGIFSLQLAVLVLIGVNDFGVSRAMTLEAIARGGFARSAELRRVVWAGIHLITAVAVMVIIVGALIMSLAIKGIPMSLDQQVSWSLLIPAAAISLVTLPARAALEVQERFGLANVLRIGGSSLLFAAPAAATYIEPTMTATSVAMLVSRLALSVASVAVTRKLLSRPDWREFGAVLANFASLRATDLHRRLIHRGGWLGGAGVASMLISYVDRFALGLLATATLTAHYVVAAELATKMWLVTGALASAMLPRLAHYWREKDKNSFDRIFSTLVFGQLSISLSAHICFVFFGEYLLGFWLGVQYDPTMAKVLAILSIGITVNSISSIHFLLLILNGRERSLANLQFATLPLTLCASLLAVQFYGVLGVAWVFTGRLIIDAFVIRALIPVNSEKLRGGVHPAAIVLWAFLILSLYLASQI